MLVEPRGKMSDTVSLSFPRDTRYYAVARLVVGGMAAPLEMSFDALDDLQLAISSLLDHEALALHGEDSDVQLRLEVSEERLVAAIGSFASGDVERALAQGAASATDEGGLGLRRLLDTIVDDVTVAPDGDGDWVTLTKHVKAHA